MRKRIRLERRGPGIALYEGGMSCEDGLLRTKKGMAWVRGLPVPNIHLLMDLLDLAHNRVKDLETRLLNEYNRNKEAQLIDTIPGIGFYGALSQERTGQDSSNPHRGYEFANRGH